MKYNAPYGISDPLAPYINGNPATGVQGSIPPAESIEYPQREVVDVINYANIHKLLDYNNVVCQLPSNGDLQQLTKAIFGMTNRQRVVVPFTFYVNGGTGNNANDGLTPLTAFQTIQAAVDAASLYSPGPNTITIQIADYLFYTGVRTPGYSIPILSFVGNATNPGNVVIDGGTYPAFWCGAYNIIILSGMTLKATGGYHYGPGSCGVCAYQYGYINIQQNVIFDRCDLACVAAMGGFIGVFYPITIRPQTCDAVLYAGGNGGTLNIGLLNQNLQVNIGGAVNCGAFATAGGGGSLSSTGVTWNGSQYVVGSKFSGNYNGLFTTLGMGLNYFPGNAAGTLSTGSLYQ